MNNLSAFAKISIVTIAFIFTACNKSAKWTSSATVSSQTYNSFSVIGNYDITGAKNDAEVGICWNDTGSPNLDDGNYNEFISTSGNLNFLIENVYANHTYYIRPFVYREDGTALLYGDEISTTTPPVPAFDNCTLTTGEVELGGTVYSMTAMSSILTSQSYKLSVTTSDFDFTFHFKEEPQSGVYIHDNAPDYLQDFQFYMSVQHLDGSGNCTYYGSQEQALHVNNNNGIIELSFCELEATTSGSCTSTILLSGALSL